MRFQLIRGRAPRLLALAVILAACSDPAGPEAFGSIQVRAFARGLAQPVTANAAEVSSLQIDRIYLVFGMVKLETAGSGTVDFVDERSIVIELEADEPVIALTADVPSGSYKELELAVDKLEQGHPTEQLLIQTYPGLENASVLVEGTLVRPGAEPEPFTFATDLDIDLEVGLLPPLLIDASSMSPKLFSVVLDVTGWFLRADGSLLDPLSVSDGSEIENAIKASIELFEDADFDGVS